MEIKKTTRANLERNRVLFLETGFIIGLSLILLAFEWGTEPKNDENTAFTAKTFYDLEEMDYTLRQEQKSEPVVPKKIIDIINIVDNDVKLDGLFDFDSEAKVNTEYDYTIIKDDDEKILDEKYVIITDLMPRFKGDDTGMEFLKYIRENLRYPSIAAENGISGRVIVQFIVNEQGRVSDVVIAASVDPALDKEALRVVLSSPLWTPGKQRGRPVRVFYTFPINFVLNNN